MQRKFKFLAIILICAFAISAVFASNPGIASWIGYSVVKLTSTAATDTFTTTVVGVGTNAVNSKITINGYQYDSGNIGSYNSGAIPGDPNTNSTVSISASGFVPSDYVVFQVTIQNTGSATLGFTNYQYTDNFVDSGGNIIGYTFPSTDPYNANYIDNPKGPYTGTWDIGTSNGFDQASPNTLTAMTTKFQTYLSNNAIVGCASTWCQDNAYVGTSLPTTLAPGATFVYYIYTGLGAQTVYGIPADLYTITIPLTAMQ